MTELVGVILGSQERGFLEDENGTMDGNPDRTDFDIEVIKGDPALFREWFLDAYGSVCAYGDLGENPHIQQYTELGFDMPSTEPGELIIITFGAWFDRWLDGQVLAAKLEINELCRTQKADFEPMRKFSDNAGH